MCKAKSSREGNCTDWFDNSLSPSRIYSTDVQTFDKEFDTVGKKTLGFF